MKIYAVIITFNPNVDNVSKLAQSLLLQNVNVVVVDNNSKNKSDLNSLMSTHSIMLSDNVGIAKAQNVGIDYAEENNAEYVVFFDQDSSIPDNYIDDLISDYKQLEIQGLKIGAIGPRFIDERFGFYYKTVNITKHGFREKMDVSSIDYPKHSALLISSGSLVSVETLKSIGLMRENYFIDYVDTEWCIRAEANGYKNYVSSKASMMHTIGDDVLQFKYFNVPVHSPFRRYYRVRNAYYMYREPHVPKLLAIREIIFNLVHQLILILFISKKKEYIASYLRGVKDGILHYERHKNG
ncbi:rhamnosyltransferase [Acinetobacter sp. ANC 4204]|uniref:rhamnosyltransferase n=1 Tax=Acinetobacter sp. ANC 4204 TaxID=1977884 RepID=UPI000A342862|nr:rhamnosyltransferase [Acinetobacter sp. ANC 4204]OTG56122.1 rhamnosyltransferase [Acinetobacter sp. ANC 4204]